MPLMKATKKQHAILPRVRLHCVLLPIIFAAVGVMLGTFWFSEVLSIQHTKKDERSLQTGRINDAQRTTTLAATADATSTPKKNITTKATTTSAAVTTVVVTTTPTRSNHQMYHHHTPMQFDIAAPPVLRSVIPAPLSSLPSYHRIPSTVVVSKQKIADYFSNWTAGVNPDQFMMYNPSLIVLPSSLRSRFLQYYQNHPLSSSGTTTTPEYLASFRLSSIHSCGFPTYAFWDHPRNVFGMALLDMDLNVIPRSDVVIDLNSHKITSITRHRFEDLRLFVLGDDDDEGGGNETIIYLSHARGLLPIRMTPPPSEEDTTTTTTNSVRNENDKLRIPNLYGNGMQLYRAGELLKVNEHGKNFQFFPKPSPPAALVTNKKEEQYADDEEKFTSSLRKRVLMENVVAPPRHVVEYELSAADASATTKNGPLLTAVTHHESKHQHPTAPTLPTGLGGVKGWSKDRSTACCVKLPNDYYRDLVAIPSDSSSDSSRGSSNSNHTENIAADDDNNNNDDKKAENWWRSSPDGYVLVGVSHTKSMGRLPMQWKEREGSFHYLSRLYAFSPHPPYQVVARSGLLCFGVGGNETQQTTQTRTKEEERMEEDPYAATFQSDEQTNGTTKMFEYRGQRYTNCPRIHYVSGMSEKVGDPSRLVLAYGVNDCYSRMVEIHKRDFAQHLFVQHAVAE